MSLLFELLFALLAVLSELEPDFVSVLLPESGQEVELKTPVELAEVLEQMIEQDALVAEEV